MTSQGPELAAVVARVEKLERQNRRLKLAGVTVLILAAAGLLMGQAVPRSRTLEAEEFILRDATGKTRAALYSLLGDVTLGLSGSAGPIRAALTVSADGTPGLYLNDQAGKTRAILEVLDSSPALILTDQARKIRVALRELDGSPSLSLYGQAGKTRAELEVLDNSPALRFTDQAGKNLVAERVKKNETLTVRI